MKMRLARKTTSFQEYNLTTQRRLLLEVLQEAQGPIDAKELYQLASTKDQHISWATVYRSLNLFEQLGLVDERRLTKAHCSYETKKSLEHMHLVCQCCGKIIEFDNYLIRELVEVVKRELNFHVTKTDLDLEGYCAKCFGEMIGY
jgi:Fur family ferric uptake transcriptional regulator